MPAPTMLFTINSIGQSLFDYDDGPADATAFWLNGAGNGGEFKPINNICPQLSATHNHDFSTNLSRTNMLPNPDFIIGAGTTGITGSSTGTVPLYYGAYNPGATEACAFSYNSSAGCPNGSGGAWKLIYSTNTVGKGLYVGSTTGYGGFKLKANTTYTLSFYVNTTLTSTLSYTGQWTVLFGGSGVTASLVQPTSPGSTIYYTGDTGWYNIYMTLTVGAADYTNTIIITNQYNPGTSQTCYIGAVKLEEGANPSTWNGAHYETGVTDFILPHPNKLIDNVPDGTTRAAILVTQLAGSTGAYTVKQLNDGTNTRTAAQIAGILTAGGLLNVAPTAGVTGTLPYSNAPTAITNVINSSSQILNVEWPGSFLNTDGSISGFTAVGLTSNQALTISSGQIVSFELEFKLGSTGANQQFAFINTTSGNNYGISWNGSTGVVAIYKKVSATTTTLTTIATIAQDTNLHSVKFTITQGASNTLEGSFDATVSSLVTDNSLTLTSNAWGFFVVDLNAGTTKIWNFQAYTAYPHYSSLPTPAKAVITSAGALATGIVVSGSIATGAVGTTQLATGAVTNTILAANAVTWKDFLGDTSGDTSTSIANTTLKRFLYSTMSTEMQTAINTSSQLVGSIYDGTTALTPANITAVISSSGVKSTVFGNTSGAYIDNSTGAIKGITATTGLTTQQTYYLSIGTPIVISGTLTLSATGNLEGIYLGNTTNGYGIEWATSGAVVLVKYVSSTRTVIDTLITTIQDLNPHAFSFALTVTATGPTVSTMSASWDYLSTITYTDSSLNPSGYGVTVIAGGTGGLLQNFEVQYGIQAWEYLAAGPVGYLMSYAGGGSVTLQNNVVVTSSITANAVTTAKIASGAITNALMAAGAITASNNTIFGTSITENSDGSWSGFSSSGNATSTLLTIGAGHVITFSVEFQLATATSQLVNFVLGSTAANGYGLLWQAGGNLLISKWVSGTRTTIGTMTAVTQDTKVHSVEVTITCVSSSSVNVECAFDNQSTLIENDTSVNLTTGTWPITITDGYNGTIKFWNYLQTSTQPTYGSLPVAVQTAVNSTGKVIGSIYDGTNTLTPANITAVITSSGALSTGIVTAAAMSTAAKSSVLEVYNHSGTLVTAPNIMICDTAVLSFASSASATVTVTLTTGYPLATSYNVVCTAQTSSLPATTLMYLTVSKTSGTVFVIDGELNTATTSTITVNISYICLPI